MSVSDLIKLKKYMPAQTIEQLTDDNNIGQISQEIVDDAALQAINVISAWIRGRYETDDIDTTPFLLDIKIRIMAYCLYRRKLQTTMPESVSKDYDDCMSTLRMIQKGQNTPFESGEPQIILTNKTLADRTYNSTVWAQYD